METDSPLQGLFQAMAGFSSHLSDQRISQAEKRHLYGSRRRMGLGLGMGLGFVAWDPFFWGNETLDAYGQFEGFLVGVGNIMIPIVARFLELKGF